VALAELLTGAGCIPCIPVDYSFDTMLKEYSRQDVVLLVYHMHAPSNDPLTNHSTESRNKYYDVNSAPTIIIDGQKFENESTPELLTGSAEAKWSMTHQGKDWPELTSPNAKIDPRSYRFEYQSYGQCESVG
jgi:hypothetical protein